LERFDQNRRTKDIPPRCSVGFSYLEIGLENNDVRILSPQMIHELLFDLKK